MGEDLLFRTSPFDDVLAAYRASYLASLAKQEKRKGKKKRAVGAAMSKEKPAELEREVFKVDAFSEEAANYLEAMFLRAGYKILEIVEKEDRVTFRVEW